MANSILKIYDDFENDLYEMEQLSKGKVHFGITNYVGALLLPSILPAFEKMAPNFEVSFEENRSLELIDHLKDGKIDFAVLHIEPSYRADNAIEYHSISTSQFLLATSHHHPCCRQIESLPSYGFQPIDIALFQNERFILTDYDQMSRNIAKRIFRTYNFSPQKTAVTRNILTAAKLAETQFGVTFFPEMFLPFLGKDHALDLYRIGDGSIAQWELVVATRAQTYMPKSTKYLTQLIKDHFNH
jgi:DNA-binding transcriptional LysR family regulator